MAIFLYIFLFYIIPWKDVGRYLSLTCPLMSFICPHLEALVLWTGDYVIWLCLMSPKTPNLSFFMIEKAFEMLQICHALLIHCNS